MIKNTNLERAVNKSNECTKTFLAAKEKIILMIVKRINNNNNNNNNNNKNNNFPRKGNTGLMSSGG